jgi:hypothetical protein
LAPERETCEIGVSPEMTDPGTHPPRAKAIVAAAPPNAPCNVPCRWHELPRRREDASIAPESAVWGFEARANHLGGPARSTG